MKLASLVLVLAFTQPACDGGQAAAPAPAPVAGLGPGVVARAAGLSVTAPTVGGIAAAQRVDAATARDLAVRDALFAAAALEAKVQRTPDVAFATTSILARALLHDLQRESEAVGDVTDEELDQATKRHWFDFDRPEAFRVVHAVVRYAEKDDAARKKKGADLADAIRRAVLATRADPNAPPVTTDAGVVDPLVTAFRTAAESVPADGLEVAVEELPPIAADSRVVAREGGHMVPEFANGAAALAARGDVSIPVVTNFGSHVLLLLERLPPVSVPADERRRQVREEVILSRQRIAEKALLEKLRASVQLDSAVDSILGSVPVE